MIFKYTIKTVIDELEKNPDRIFNQVEIAFFWRWWRESSDEDRARLTALVKNGQFHFLNAGWCMHDEAIVNYRDMIVNMDLGLRWIRDHFGCESRPHSSWQIDVFGHSGYVLFKFECVVLNGTLSRVTLKYQTLKFKRRHSG